MKTFAPGMRSVVISIIMFAASSAWSGSLTIAPTSLDVRGSSAALTLRTDNSGQVAGQIRVMRWKGKKPAEGLSPSRDVVASPPALRLRPNSEVTVRLVRKSRRAIRGKECYRVFVDQLPTAKSRGFEVNMMIRHSIPLCFHG